MLEYIKNRVRDIKNNGFDFSFKINSNYFLMYLLILLAATIISGNALITALYQISSIFFIILMAYTIVMVSMEFIFEKNLVETSLTGTGNSFKEDFAEMAPSQVFALGILFNGFLHSNMLAIATFILFEITTVVGYALILKYRIKNSENE